MLKHTIKLKNYSKVIEEYEAATAIAPGMLVEIYSTDGKVRKHATVGGNNIPMFALEDELQGKGIDNNYAAGDRVQVWIPGRGDIVYALLADGQNVVVGDYLQSDGLGRLQKHTAQQLASADAQQVATIYSRPIVGQVLEAQDLSALDGSNSSLEGNSQHVAVRIV